MTTPNSPRKPPWLKVALPSGERFRAVRGAVKGHGLHTVCQEARCPNIAECWGCGTATFLILGDTCSRGCSFCAVRRGDPGGDLDTHEARRVAEAARSMDLAYVVVTSVTRDDLEDGGASVYAQTVRCLKGLSPAPRVELLIPDYTGAELEAVLEAGPDVLAHNLEVVERLTGPLRHRNFSYRRSLEVLRQVRKLAPHVATKSSIMLGLGEDEDEVLAAMSDLRDVEVEILVLGQYLQPTGENAPVHRYVPPETFDRLAELGRAMGFGFVAAGPLVRTSYRAAEGYVEHRRSQPGGE